MRRRYPDLTFGDSVKAVQQRYGSRDAAERRAQQAVDDRHLSEREAEFIAARDSFYLASVGESGWPYVQFRGGPIGFLWTLDPSTLGYADFRGNRQYITTGNVQHDDRVAMILMDYPRRQRLKLMARMEIREASDCPELVGQLHDASYDAKVERAVLFHVEAFDWNCPQHITPRYTLEELKSLAP